MRARPSGDDEVRRLEQEGHEVLAIALCRACEELERPVPAGRPIAWLCPACRVERDEELAARARAKRMAREESWNA
jgi:hypothetical protein